MFNNYQSLYLWCYFSRSLPENDVQSRYNTTLNSTVCLFPSDFSFNIIRAVITWLILLCVKRRLVCQQSIKNMDGLSKHMLLIIGERNYLRSVEMLLCKHYTIQIVIFIEEYIIYKSNKGPAQFNSD